MGLMRKFWIFSQKDKGEGIYLLRQSLDLVMKEPNNPRGHLKLADIYKRRNEKDKALTEYLRSAEIFSKNDQYPEAMAIYKQLQKQIPSLGDIHFKMADLYIRMGFLGEAFVQYKNLVKHYDQLGMKEKALEVMDLMADLDPRRIALETRVQSLKKMLPLKGEGEEVEKTVQPQVPFEGFLDGEKEKAFFDLSAELEKKKSLSLEEIKTVSILEKIYGYEDILRGLKESGHPSMANPNFDYYLGLASRQMGFLDDAIDQFQIALEKGQNSFEAASFLGICLKEKGRKDEASKVFERALQMGGISPEKKLDIKYQLGLIYKEQGKTEEALKLLKEISAE